MAKNKIERIDQEIAKTREKIAEQQEKLKALEAQKTEAENLEIVQMVARPAHDPGPAERPAVWRHGARSDGGFRRFRTGGYDPWRIRRFSEPSPPFAPA